MSLPIVLPTGYVLIYGEGMTRNNTGGTSQIVADNTDFRFGTVYQIWSGGTPFIYGSGMVMFNNSDVQCRLLYNDYPYTLIHAARLAITEDIIIPP